MITRKYIVDGQTIKLVSKEKIASDQIGFTLCQFSFSEHWKSFEHCFAQFRQADATIEQMLDES